MRIERESARRFPAAAVLLVAVALAGASGAARAVTLTENFDQTYSLAAGGSLDVANTNGAVTLEVWDRAEVRVEALKRVKAATDDRAHQLMSELKIEVTPAAGSLRVSTVNPQSQGLLSWLFGSGSEAQVEYHLHVPRRVALSAETVNGSVFLAGTEGRVRLRSTNGTLKVTGVRGPLDLETTNGGIDVRQSAGGLRAETTNGSIAAELTQVEERVALESTNGSLTLRVPATLRATVDADTTNGTVRSDLPVATATSSSKRHLRGAINGGGSDLKLSTTNGSIHIYGL